LWGVVLGVGLALSIALTPLGNAFFGTAPIGPEAWLMALPFALALILLEEVAMSTSTLRAPRDLTRINLHEEWEVVWWSAKFSVTPEALRAAVAEVGPTGEEVEKRLKKAAKESFKGGGED
jgi:hypothetical protein